MRGGACIGYRSLSRAFLFSIGPLEGLLGEGELRPSISHGSIQVAESCLVFIHRGLVFIHRGLVFIPHKLD